MTGNWSIIDSSAGRDGRAPSGIRHLCRQRGFDSGPCRESPIEGVVIDQGASD